MRLLQLLDGPNTAEAVSLQCVDPKQKEGSAISQAHLSFRLALFQGRCIRSECFTYHCDHPSAERDGQHKETEARKDLDLDGIRQRCRP